MLVKRPVCIYMLESCATNAAQAALDWIRKIDLYAVQAGACRIPGKAPGRKGEAEQR
ncbi:MAG: hypothetical protein HKO84_03860 [Pseudomonadales bacterium]|nr:hypothetical protein [Pseudomonadales bacterium]